MKAINFSSETGPLEPQVQRLLEKTAIVEVEDFPYWRQKLSNHGFTGSQIATILSQWELRKQGLGKFGKVASHMLFTRSGLEQASQMAVADYHAGIFRDAGVKTVADLGCGLGADTLAFSRAQMTVTAVDIDPETAAYTAFNLKHYPQAQVFLGSAQEYLKTTYSQGLIRNEPRGLFADPARRNQSGRVLNPEHWSPPLSEIISWHNDNKYLGIKIAPGIKYENLPENFHTRWVAVGEDLVEATIWSESLIAPGRSAMIIHPDHTNSTLFIPNVTSPRQPPSTVPTTKLGQYLFEANPALLRAGGLSYLARTLDAGLISPAISYLTGNNLPPAEMQPWLRNYKIIKVLPLRAKVIAQELAKMGTTRIDIKKRGWKGDPAQFRKKLLRLLPAQKCQPNTTTLVFSRVEGQHCCLVVDPL